MAKLQRCDLCGAEAEELMSIEFPYEERWMLFFRKKSFCHYADVCLDCLEEIRAKRQTQIEASRVDFDIADTPQTESYYTDATHFGKAKGESTTTSTADTPHTDKNDRSTAEFITGTQIGDAKPIPNSTTTWASTNTPQTDHTEPIECKGCTKHICYGCEHRAKKEAWRKAQTDCGWK